MTRSEPVLLIVTPPRQHRIMIVIATPTGTIGAAVAESLNAAGQALRLIVRDPAKLPPRLTQHAEVVVGSHNDPAVLDQALTGADALFVVVPPDFRADDVTEYYLGFARPIADAVRVSRGSSPCRRWVGASRNPQACCRRPGRWTASSNPAAPPTGRYRRRSSWKTFSTKAIRSPPERSR
ncbi:NAD(P)H-binding protein [Gordonia bronchialis]|nr:NAD(P)H-binding protein [Gordonia bronchialis]